MRLEIYLEQDKEFRSVSINWYQINWYTYIIILHYISEAVTVQTMQLTNAVYIAPSPHIIYDTFWCASWDRVCTCRHWSRRDTHSSERRGPVSDASSDSTYFLASCCKLHTAQVHYRHGRTSCVISGCCSFYIRNCTSYIRTSWGCRCRERCAGARLSCPCHGRACRKPRTCASRADAGSVVAVAAIAYCLAHAQSYNERSKLIGRRTAAHKSHRRASSL